MVLYSRIGDAILNAIVMFFRDVLSGSTYIIVSLICFILICLCIWKLFRRSIKSKKVREEYQASHVVIINENGVEEVIDISKPTIVSPNTSNVAANVVDASLTNTSAINVAFSNTSAPSVTNSTNLVNTIDNKPSNVVMINPMEVAAISSTMNLIGSEKVKDTSATLGTKQNTDTEVNNGDNAGTNVSVSNSNQ